MKKITSVFKLTVLVLFSQILLADSPDWNFGISQAAQYEFTGTLTGIVDNDGEQLGDDANDLLAAFDADGEIRGLAVALTAPFGPYQGTLLYELQVYSNSAGEELNFQFYDASEDKLLTISNTYTFVINDISGNVPAPYIFEVGSEDLGCPPCEDVEFTTYTFDCSSAISIFGGCDFGVLAEECPVSCGECPEEDECGVCEGDGSSCEGECADSDIAYGMECATAVAVLGCGFDGGSGLISDLCPESCGACCVDADLDDICDDVDDCVGAYDECGECNGDGISDGACDCAGSVDDCSGECGGSAVVDECGECGGDNSTCSDCAGVPNGDAEDLGCGCGEAAPSGCDNECGSTAELDECGECDGDNACLAGSGLSAIGGLNEVMLQWDYNPSASSYNIYRNGEQVCSTPVDMPYYLDDGTCFDETGWGLGFDTEYCYSVTAVGQNGSEGANSDDACATTLPQLQAFLDLDLSFANADIAAEVSPFGDLTGDGNADAVIMVNMVNFFPVNGYQFSFNLNPGIVDVIAAIDGTYMMSGGAAGLTAQLGDGLVLGADLQLTGGTVPPGYPGDGGNEGNLLAVLVLSPQYTGSGDDVNVTISDFVVSGVNPFTGESVTLNACDADLDPLNGCFDVDSFSTPAADCAGIPSGSSALDECGVCNGDGIADGACDCDGNVLDCADNCGGDAVIDDCGDCDGGNFGDADGDGTCDANDSTPNGEVSLSFQSISSDSAIVQYDSDVDIYGYQFAVEGVVVTDAWSWLDVTEAGNNIVVSFSLEGHYLSACSDSPYCGFATIYYEESADERIISLSDIIISGIGGSSISVSGPSDGVVPGCNNADCFGECGGSASIDECGVCGGDSSSCADCAGVPNGDAEDLGCGCGEAAPSGCDNECGSTAELDECGVCGGSGFPFTGGEVQCWNEPTCDNGYGGNYFGINLSIYYENESSFVAGETITIEHEGVTHEFTYSHTATGNSNWPEGFGLVFITGDYTSSLLNNTFGEKIITGDSWYFNNSVACDCDGNELDCSGECGGSASIDECGVCGGDSSSCADCAGVPNGNSWDSDCGCVASENSGDDCDDCAGVPNGDSWDSDCGCVASDNSGDDCDDCAGVPSGDSEIDCTGACGGDTLIDACGVCGGDGSSCTYGVVQSTEQAIYYFDEASLDGVELTEDDWIIAKNGDVLVGASQYIATNGGTIEVIVMGEDLNCVDGVQDGPVNTCGMMLLGQTPQFYVFDASAPAEHIANYSAADGTELQNIPTYQAVGINAGLTLNLTSDCNDDLGGAAVTSGLCGDCWGGNTDLALNYMDTDDDGVCNDGAANGDDDNCPDTPNTDQADNDVDALGDLCDDDDDNDGCTDDVDDDQMTWDDDYDTDGTPDDCDGDDDNDGAADDVDSDDNDEFVCNDDDGDTCDECSSGSYDSSNDGWDYDSDGACDASDDDDDNDGAADDVDSDDNNEFVCSDDDGDTCDDCSSGSYDTSDDGADNDSDGACDISDPDDDNDGCEDDVDDAQFEFDDDYDTDGTPDDCDGDDDNDGAADGVDSDDNNEFVCSDDDNDTCDDCSSGSYNVANDGVDGDGDGTCDDGDSTPGGEITLNFSNATENSIDIEYSSDVSIAGYQFTVEGVDLISASDGALTVQSANNGVIGFSLSGDSLPAGSGSFASLVFFGDLDGATIGLSNLLVAQNSTYSLTVYGPGTTDIVPCTNFDDDELCDIDVDTDDDNDLSSDDDDSDDNNPNVCSDDDGDTCDDCTYGSYDTINDGPNNDDDQICDATDPDDDNDGCDDDVDDDQMTWDDDYDTDGTPDDCDGDDDNDGAADGVDSDDNNEFVCNDDDDDTCDECSSGSYDSSNDGWDYDSDGACDAGDDDDDNDGALDGVDSDDNNEFECSYDDADNCDDCSSGVYDLANDGPDNESDGLCDDGDPDDDNDGCDDDVDDDQMTWDDDYDTDGTPDDCDGDDDNDGAADGVDSDDNNEFVCNDDDDDTCDECSSGSYDSSDDGWDYDGDGACDAGDDDDDNDGASDDNDSADNNEYECHDDDGDLCDECSSGSEESTSNDGWDYDGDGACDAGDDDDDNDGALDGVDSDDNNEFECSFDDADNCDDCSSGVYDLANDGPDNESDGLCDDGDPDDDNDGCTDDVDDDQMTFDDDYDTDGTPDDCDNDDDNDGASDGVDSDDNNEFVCSDDDNDTCDDCSSGTYNVTGDGVDGDSDGLCDDGDPTPGGEITLSFTNATETTIDIEYLSDVSIAGYQFAVNGVSLINASDGDLEIFAENNIVVAFGYGVSLPACPDGGCAFASLLFYAELEGADISFSDVLIGQNSDYQLAVSGPGTAAIAECTNFDADDLCDIDVDSDDDNDGSADEVDSDDNNPLACSDDDNDTCDDCSDGSYGVDSDGPDNDADGACDAGDSDDDNDGCDDDVDDDQMTWDDDYDTDGTPDDCDGDDDNDGAADGVDSDDNNEFVCNDDDDDTCDECSSGSYDSSNDGTDNDSDGICNDGDDDDDNDGAADDFDSDDNNPFVCSDDDDDLCDDCSDGSYGLDSDGPDFDEDGICDAGDPAAPSVVQTIGAANEVHIGHSHSIHAAQGLEYNIYRDGELVGNSVYGMYTNPAFEAAGGDAGLAYGYVDPDGGWGLEYVTEYCYTVTSVNPEGRESNDASTVSCSTTLPPSTVGLQVTADPDGSIGGVPNAIYVHMINLWWVSGYQFDISFDTDQVAVAQMIAGHPSMDGQLYSDGTTMGFSFSGSQIDPTWYPNPENTYDPVLIAAYVFTPTTDEFSNDITVNLSDWTFGGDEGQLLFASDMEFIHLDGSDVSDAFEYSVDCSGEQYSGEGAAELGEGSDGWDYTDQCGECDDNALTDCYDLSIDLGPGANLISFPALPVDISVENIFAGTEGVIGEGIGAINIDGNWIGSLTEVSQDDGYWVKTSSAFTIEHADADPVNYDGEEVVYSMHVGNNLISYPFQGSQSPDEALGDNASNVYALVGEGIATLNTEDGWVGSLTALVGERGYWLVSEADFSFTFNGTSSGLARQVDVRNVPTAFEYLQSDQQAFVFVESATIRGEILGSEDLIIAYNGDQVVGSRYWNDQITDVPAIGVDSDNSDLFSGYCKEGDVITFKVLDESTGELIDMDTDGEIVWTSMGISLISMTDIFVPTEVSLGNAYPNPFNPVTMLTYDVPAEMVVSMGVYDVRGRLVHELVQGSHDAGRYEVTWNADQNSSGVYIVKMSAGTSVKVQKVMLVK